MLPRRFFALVCLIFMFDASIDAVAQSGTAPTNKTVPTVQLPGVTPGPALDGALSEEEIRAKSADWHAQCMRDWDQQTHMTKREWFSACQRTVNDRIQWLRGRGKQ
jgi:hypothetical protein